MNVIEAFHKKLEEYSEITGVGIDFTADADGSFGLSSTGDRLVKKTIGGKEERQHTFTFYAMFQSVNDYDRLANTGFLLELAQYIESLEEIPVEQAEKSGSIRNCTTANGMLYEIPNGSITTAWRYQLQITVNYYLESEDIYQMIIGAAKGIINGIKALFSGEVAETTEKVLVSQSAATSAQIENQEALTDAVNETAKAEQKLIAGFDKVTKVQASAGGASVKTPSISFPSIATDISNSVAGASAPLGGIFEGIKAKIQQIIDKIKELWEKSKPYIEKLGSSFELTLETVTITTAANTSIHISNLKSYESFIFVLNGAGTKYFDNCIIYGSGQFLQNYIVNNAKSKLFANNCTFGNTYYSSMPFWIINKSECEFSNCFLSGKFKNESGRVYISNCWFGIDTGTYSTLTNQATVFINNSYVNISLDQTAAADLRINNCYLTSLIANRETPLWRNKTESGNCYFDNCYINTGGGSNGVGSYFNGKVLKINNCTMNSYTRFVCNKPTANLIITNNIFKSSKLDYSSEYSGGGLKLGTDNTTIPKYYVSGNTFETACVIIGGNEVTYVTADNGHYMPEFSNEFATITVTFNANDGTVTPATKDVVLGHPYGELPTPTKADSTFVEWNTASDGTGDTVTSSTIVNSSAAHALYAIWTEAT